jgi:hypothetical protein
MHRIRLLLRVKIALAGSLPKHNFSVVSEFIQKTKNTAQPAAVIKEATISDGSRRTPGGGSFFP